MESPDFSRFVSRFHFKGLLIFDSAHRIGAERSLAVDTPDTPILRTVDGRPYIPGSSIKGAWRSYTEAVLRTLQEQQGHARFTNDPLAQGDKQDNGLTPQKMQDIKRDLAQEPQTVIDARLRDASTWVERLFGNPGLASKVLIKDTVIEPGSWLRSEVRDGVGIDRDAGRAADTFKYQFEVTPAGARFPLEILVDNAAPAELGLVIMGLKAFERGDILLGGAKSRGLGWCHLDTLEWQETRYITADNLLDYLLSSSNEATQVTGQVTPNHINGWLGALRQAIQAAGEAHHA